MNTKAETNLSELMAQVNSITVITEPEPGRIDVRSKLSALWDKVHGVFTPKVQAIAGAAKSAKLENQTSYNEAVNLLKTIKGTQNDLERFKMIPDRLHALWKENLEEWKKDGALLAQAEIDLKTKIIAFDKKKQAEEDAKQAAADAANRKKAQEEADERARLARQAGASKSEVAEIKKSAETIPLPEVKPTLERSAAAKTVENWQADPTRDSRGNLVDSEFAKLVAYIVTGKEDAKLAHPEFLCVLEINQPRLRDLAKAQRQHLKLPSIKVYDRGSLRASAF
jgi:hypothetical protein